MRAYGHESDGVTRIPHEAEYLIAAARKLLDEDATLGDVAEWMTKTAGPTVSGRPWAPTTLRRRLRNPAIAGLRRNADDELVSGVAEPLMERELFEAIDGYFKERERGQVPQRAYLLSCGIAMCDPCGSELVSRSSSKGARGYQCEADGCGKIWISAPPLDEYVSARALARLERPSTLQKLRKLRDDLQVAAEAAAKKVPELDKRKRELAAALGATSLTMEEYRLAKSSLDQTRKDVLAILRRAKYLDELPELTIEGLSDWWANTSGNEQRRALLQLVIREVRVEPATKRGSNKFDEQRFNIIYR
ncbi:recombinase family protein [Streptomyces sp. TRM66268-LWL]|uniref:Recombinase family protein n=1 Tax=Streptomyces polyasparticus TaxID=2767826 RepID=A0ABR7SQV0_9ACTN|nr:recombinase family protein [Streptomyces polyasparticus]MBC9717871.1 recombinase family protein [Streptomyces polyasparticus]